MIKFNNVKIGADPELFIANSNGKIISAEGLIGGTKDDPKKISEEGHAIQEDNVMAEFNIPACIDAGSFKDNINHVLEYLTTLGKLQGFVLSDVASARLDDDQVNTIQAKTFGCDRDYIAYIQDLSPMVTLPKDNFRCCGGHIHVGYDNPDELITEQIVFAMDMTLGIESVLLDNDTERRKLYGKAGSFRFKDYGLEYRTLSNFWIHSDEKISWAFKRTMDALELVESGMVYELIKEYGQRIEKCINTSNKKEARELIKIIKQIKVEIND